MLSRFVSPSPEATSGIVTPPVSTPQVQAGLLYYVMWCCTGLDSLELRLYVWPEQSET